jgi:hypothetical protein
MNTTFRPPAVPLIAHDPYFSIWSFADHLTDEPTKHWTGTCHNIGGFIRIDGQPYHFCGGWPPKHLTAMNQISVKVLPTRTIYEFESAGVRLTLTFLTPALPHDLDVLSRPVTYVIFDVRGIDGNSHEIGIQFQADAEITQNHYMDEVVWSRARVAGLTVMSMAGYEQRVLRRSGDDIHIEWGSLYLAAAEGTDSAIGENRFLADGFVAGRPFPEDDDMGMPRAINHGHPVLALRWNFRVAGNETIQRHAMVAYDDRYSLEYLKRRLRPWWRRTGWEAGDLLRTAEKEFSTLYKACVQFDSQIMEELSRVGGEKYALLCALAFRQCLAAHKLAADLDGSPIYMSKENSSNGCINTVDVIYPAAPFFLIFNPELLKAQITPLMDYASSPRWKFPFAPHDMGTYPLANGQTYGGGERTEDGQMPVEECGNMLILMAALIQSGETIDYALKYWPKLQQWANYLREKGLDPEEQLCTDDFAGHVAHNANLSLKAIVALGSYAQLCQKAGKNTEASEYGQLAKKMALEWETKADDGGHYRRTFDQADTWSQKYNLVWDRLLGLDLFSQHVFQKELNFYLTKLNTYGLPLDSNAAYAKLDWTFWTASMAESREVFDQFLDPVFQWVNETDSRVPLSDWYWTDSVKRAGFQARSVVGGVFIKLLRARLATPHL